MVGTLWDAQLKLLVKNGMLPTEALSQGALAEELSAFDTQRRDEQAAASTAAGHATQTRTDPIDDSKVDLTVDAIQVNGTRSKVDIRLSALSDEKRLFSRRHLRGPGRTLRPTSSC